jgi:hypothetical protein
MPIVHSKIKFPRVVVFHGARILYIVGDTPRVAVRISII